VHHATKWICKEVFEGNINMATINSFGPAGAAASVFTNMAAAA
jgi:hypothetical protein